MACGWPRRPPPTTPLGGARPVVQELLLPVPEPSVLVPELPADPGCPQWTWPCTAACGTSAWCGAARGARRPYFNQLIGVDPYLCDSLRSLCLTSLWLPLNVLPSYPLLLSFSLILDALEGSPHNADPSRIFMLAPGPGHPPPSSPVLSGWHSPGCLPKLTPPATSSWPPEPPTLSTVPHPPPSSQVGIILQGAP